MGLLTISRKYFCWARMVARDMSTREWWWTPPLSWPR